MNSIHKKDYYAILGVSRDADQNEIRLAYRKQALQNHPDTNRDDPWAEDRFKKINEAYEVLGNRDKKNLYDQGRDPRAKDSPLHHAPFDPFETGFFSGLRCRGGGFGRGLDRRRRAFHGTGASPAGFGSSQSALPIHDLVLTADETREGTERDIRLHIAQDTLVFTVSIPPMVENGTLLHFKHSTGNGQEIELQFRVKIAE